MEFKADIKDIDLLKQSLDKLHKSAFPTAIRDTLNQTAFDVKKEELLKSAKSRLIIRKESFLKKNSGVDKANGWNVSDMVAVVGVTKNESTKGIDKQEDGGEVSDRGYIPMKTARASSNLRKKVSRSNYISSKPIVSGRGKSVGRSNKDKFIRAIMVAKQGGFVLHNRTIFKVNKLSSNMKSRKLNLKATPIFTYNKGKKAKLKPTKFLEHASIQSAKKQQVNFDKFAEKQISKLKIKGKI